MLSEFQLCVGWGEGELQENFKKDVLFYEGTQILQGLLPMIVGYVWFQKPLSHSSSLFKAKGADTLLAFLLFAPFHYLRTPG